LWCFKHCFFLCVCVYFLMVEDRRLELLTYGLQSRRSPN
jgi:hypothetical protein